MSARAIPKVAQVGAAAKVQYHHSLAGSALLSEADWAETARMLRLSGRELQIVRGVFDNQKETTLAADLGIAPRTVNTHMERLHRKLAVTTRVALVLRVMATLQQAKAKPETGSKNVLTATTPFGPRARGVG
jgi:DNA-binding CsgD family transcriptional regulator